MEAARVDEKPCLWYNTHGGGLARVGPPLRLKEGNQLITDVLIRQAKQFGQQIIANDQKELRDRTRTQVLGKKQALADWNRLSNHPIVQAGLTCGLLIHDHNCIGDEWIDSRQAHSMSWPMDAVRIVKGHTSIRFMVWDSDVKRDDGNTREQNVSEEECLVFLVRLMEMYATGRYCRFPRQTAAASI